MSKVVELTGSPKPYFATKELLLEQLADFGYSHGKMSKKDNKVDILLTDDLNKSSSKMLLAKSLGVEIMSYEDITELFGLNE
jgi:stalled ribosome alternative rescue factor ArfA